jgi:hypothetical protein
LILRSKAVWLGDVEAASEAEAIAKGAQEFKPPQERLMAVEADLIWINAPQKLGP